MTCGLIFSVGVTRFELATSRPPDAYSKPTELHPERFALCPQALRPSFLKASAKLMLFFLSSKFLEIFF